MKRLDLLPKTHAEKEAHFIEECGEALYALGKLKRFGPLATDPVTGIMYHNQADLIGELGDLITAALVFRESLVLGDAA